MACGSSVYYGHCVMENVRIITQPPVEPITLTEAKRHLNVDSDFTDDDAYIESLIKASRIAAENYTRRAYVQRTLELSFPYFCEIVIELPYPKLQSITSITYKDNDGTDQTISAANYQIDSYREPGLVMPAYQCYWPTAVRADLNSVRVRYVAGVDLGTGSPTDYTSNIPEVVKQWMKVRIAGLYEMRTPVVTSTITSLPRDYVDGLLDSQVVSLF
jgi:uncharacterized phiE125 gp8 family phage protein